VDVRIHDLLARAARVHPSSVAATLGDDARTFATLDRNANRAAHRLTGEGVAPLDRVVWWGPPTLDAFEVGYGISKLGATLAPLNPHFTEPEAATALETLRPRLVVAHPDVEATARASAGPLGITVATSAPGWLDGAADAPPPRAGTSEDTCAIFLTSGSTGTPKGARLSHRAAWLRALQRDTDGGAVGTGGAGLMFGQFHMAGWATVEAAWARDRSVHLVHHADPHELLTAVERWRITTLYCIPGIWQRILDDRGGYDTSSLREVLTGTSFVTPDLIDALKARFPGTWTSITYGSTEIGRGAVLLDRDLRERPGSVGLPPPMIDADIDAAGELLLSGPTMFSGYLDRPDATAEAIDADGWFHTGDLAARDDDGFLTITGRRSESIRSGGEWVAPVEVERAVLTHPAVVEVGVVGLPDPRWGEVVCAAIVVRPGATLPTLAQLRAHVAATLIGPKQPRVVVEVAELPRTDATGQIRRARLRDAILASRA
jgi:fatty-acyl-CoA synthase